MANSMHSLIVVIVNDSLRHWCDYPSSTIRYLKKKHHVVVFCEGDVLTWKTMFGKNRPYPVVERRQNTLFYHPFFGIPGQRFLWVKQLNYCLNAFFLRLFITVRFPSDKQYLWFFNPLYMSTMLKIFFGFYSVYDYVDYYRGVSLRLARQDTYLLTHSTFVFANSFTLAKKLRPIRNAVNVVPLGFSLQLFQRHTNKPSQLHQRPIAGFVGGITPRIDFSLLTVVAKQNPHIIFAFYGQLDPALVDANGQITKRVRQYFALPNVRWHGYVPKRAIPAIISSFTLGCIPYRVDDPFNAYCFPMKVMEYFYAGKPVLATPIEELRRFPKFVFLGSSPASWTAALATISSRHWPKKIKEEERSIAKKNSWDAKLSAMTRIIFDNTSRRSLWNRIVTRGMTTMGSLFYWCFIVFLCIFSFPCIIVIGAGIFFSSGRPVFFVQKRVGKHGKIFSLYKFRTMYPNAENDQQKYRLFNEVDGPVFKIHNDPRFTPMGKFLSHTGLDELPQLWNILCGEMALFGPRPLPVAEAKRLLLWQKKRSSIKPGILSPWVFHGYHKRTFIEWMHDDVLYVSRKSFWYDVGLFVKSIRLMIQLFIREALNG